MSRHRAARLSRWKTGISNLHSLKPGIPYKLTVSAKDFLFSTETRRLSFGQSHSIGNPRQISLSLRCVIRRKQFRVSVRVLAVMRVHPLAQSQ